AGLLHQWSPESGALKSRHAPLKFTDQFGRVQVAAGFTDRKEDVHASPIVTIRVHAVVRARSRISAACNAQWQQPCWRRSAARSAICSHSRTEVVSRGTECTAIPKPASGRRPRTRFHVADSRRESMRYETEGTPGKISRCRR